MTNIMIDTNATKRRSSILTTRFLQDESGSVTIFACFLIVMMVFVGGIGADLMRNEFERTRLQAVSDRAVLAAASLNQPLDPEAVVRDYFDKAGLGDYVSNVIVDDSPNSRSVTVDATNNVSQTQFMSFLGVDTLPVPARARAEDLNRNVEISLVLDISGSMRHSSRIDNLRPAAQQFIDTVMADGSDQYTTISLVPYAGQTNPGPVMFDLLSGTRQPATPLDESLGGIPETASHGLLDAAAVGGVGALPNTRYVFPNVSSCLEIEGSDFSNNALPSGGTIQTPHFMNWVIAPSVMDWGWCPQDQTSIQYLSNDIEGLKNTIGSMRLHDGTGTHYAMKYAVSLLDPSSRNEVNALIGAGQVDPSFAGRPANYNDDQAVKYIILMTDGQITEQLRPIDPLDTQNPTVELNEGRRSERTQLTDASTNVSRFFAQCDLAKSRAPQPIIVYTIAFEAPGVPEQQMRECASSPAHFYSATGGSIGDVFESIALQIHQLKLTN